MIRQVLVVFDDSNILIAKLSLKSDEQMEKVSEKQIVSDEIKGAVLI